MLPLLISAQITTCDNGKGVEHYRITAPSGLNIRTKPTTNSEKVHTIPFGELVICCASKYKREVIEGKEGFWIPVFYGDYTGYIFSGFLKKEQSIHLICPSDLFLEWKHIVWKKVDTYFGLNPDTLRSSNTIVTTVSTKDTLIETSHPFKKQPKVVFKEKREHLPQFMVSGINLYDTDELEGQFYSNGMLFPGDHIYFNGALIYATGTPVLSKDSFYPFAELKEYKLILRQKDEKGGFVEQTLLEHHFIRSGAGLEGGITIRWVGDLDQDGKTDILLAIWGKACWDRILLLSSKATGGKLIGEAARYGVCAC